jgi:hypothetical protein
LGFLKLDAAFPLAVVAGLLEDLLFLLLFGLGQFGAMWLHLPQLKHVMFLFDSWDAVLACAAFKLFVPMEFVREFVRCCGRFDHGLPFL